MKAFSFFLALFLSPVGLVLAQTKPASSTTTPTQPASTTATGNRMQDLYDEHHGITKKTASPAATPSPARADQQVYKSETTPASQPDQVMSANATTRIGFRGGVTYPFFTETRTDVDPVLGFVGGLTFNFGTRTLSFQPEINYTRYSTKLKLIGFTSTVANDILEVPLFLKIASGTYAGNRFFLNVGPYASYRMSASEDGKKVSLNGTSDRFGFGAAAGVGAAIKAGPGHVTVEVRGLYPLGTVDTGFNTNSKTIFGQGTLGYIFPLGGR